ncbi:SulP family inorganic anion transporter [Kitasatospora sp. MBT63]|uniref:SulP family inorganic anion transporter n=1 Tax=Kitasatospora sp. MBT63 TaxID=1444768 RepID=UPI0005397D9D|nr:SulP family inorganic anion transporter [Kitasatospora sp. MBT63]
MANLVPASMRGYRRAWLGRDVLAGVALAAVAIPEVMGYSSIAGMPVVTGLYTLILPAVTFALLGSSKLLVVGADSATAAILFAGLLDLGIVGLAPGSPKWVGLAGLTALLSGVILAAARLLRLGFLADFLSAAVLIGFLTGVGIQVATAQIPELLGIPSGRGNWFQRQWSWLTHLDQVSWRTVAYGAATIVIILVFKRFLPRFPGSVVAVVALIAVSAATGASGHGVAVVGAVQGGFPPLGMPSGLTPGDVSLVFSVALSCSVLILAQSAATAHAFATRHGDDVDIDRDLVGLSVANLAAGLSGTFVVNGSPTKTEILDQQRGRTQVANLTTASITLLVVLVLSSLLADMPLAVLAGIVFLVGLDLVDVRGLRRIYVRRRNEFVVAAVTAFAVFGIGVEQGVLLAVAISLFEVVRREYRPRDFVVGVTEQGEPTYRAAEPGIESAPGLIVFRFNAELFYANVGRFADQVRALVDDAPDPVRWLVLDAAGIADIDYSAGVRLHSLLDFLTTRRVCFVLARPDTALVETLKVYELWQRIPPEHVFGNLIDAIRAYPAGGPPAATGEPPAG